MSGTSMKNINLNAGGLIGALACGAIAAAIVFLTVDMQKDGRPAKLVILAVIGGAFVGNFLWERVFQRPS